MTIMCITSNMVIVKGNQYDHSPIGDDLPSKHGFSKANLAWQVKKSSAEEIPTHAGAYMIYHIHSQGTQYNACT